MAVRPYFVATTPENGIWNEFNAEFKFFPGLSISQKRKNICALHESILRNKPDLRILEVSSKSEDPLGRALSAFNLCWNSKVRSIPIECIFQSSKVFEKGGPYHDLLSTTPISAKRDPRLQSSGRLIRFQTKFETWPLTPTTCFYDFIYLSALRSNPDIAQLVLSFDTFTDIEFNPKRSLNCQARSVAIFVALSKAKLLDYYLSSQKNFLTLYNNSNLLFS